MNDLLQNLDKIHTTEMGIVRFRRNLELETEDVVKWCKEKIKQSKNITRVGKNWYVIVEDIKLTVNAHSFTIITAHKIATEN